MQTKWILRFQRVFKGLYPFLFSGIAAVIPFCGVPETVDYFQSHAVGGVEEKDEQHSFPNGAKTPFCPFR